MNRDEITASLKRAGFRCTTARVDVLAFLQEQERPVGIDSIGRAVPLVNLVTLYRMMDAFVQAGLVNAYDLGHGHADYELANRPHHHHAICDGCGKVEDVYSCATVCRFEQAIAQAAKEMETITHHSASFFGTCRSCK